MSNPIEICNSDLGPKSLPWKLTLDSQWQKSSRISNVGKPKEKKWVLSAITQTTPGYNLLKRVLKHTFTYLKI